MIQAFVQLWATVDGDGAASSDGDGLHQFCIGWAHLRNFSKGLEVVP